MRRRSGAFPEPDNARERIDDPEASDGRDGKKQTAIVGAEVECAIEGFAAAVGKGRLRSSAELCASRCTLTCWAASFALFACTALLCFVPRVPNHEPLVSSTIHFSGAATDQGRPTATPEGTEAPWLILGGNLSSLKD